MINLIPMAGRGKRFFSEKYRLPKPFIPVQGNDAFISAVSSFPSAEKYVFLTQEAHVDRYNMERKLNDKGWHYNIVSLNQVTEGQACTCLLAKDYFKKIPHYLLRLVIIKWFMMIKPMRNC